MPLFRRESMTTAMVLAKVSLPRIPIDFSWVLSMSTKEYLLPSRPRNAHSLAKKSGSDSGTGDEEPLVVDSIDRGGRKLLVRLDLP